MSNPKRKRVAIVGGGIAGLASAWLLNPGSEVTLFEAGSYLGGHTNTVDVHLDGHTYPVDTGFLVFNEKTYPNLNALLERLGVASVATEMSFAVSLQEPDLEWAGSSLATLFRQKRNLLRPRFWRMLADILRFNRESVLWLAKNPHGRMTLGQYLAEENYSSAFADWYMLPMAAAIWSCPTGEILSMPFAAIVRFCANHGLLQVSDRPLWRTVQGGAREYVRKIALTLDDVRLACPVQAVHRDGARLRVDHLHGSEHFDNVIMACHSDQALAILGQTASPGQRDVLAAIRYAPNRAILHTDRSLLPRDEGLWSAWNYTAEPGADATAPVGVSYLINRLQPLPFKTPVVVSLNPGRAPRPECVLAEFDYAHPIFDAAAIAAQHRLAGVQGQNGIWLAGAWGSYGFHEDGLASALRVANDMDVYAPWQQDMRPATPLRRQA
jgi:predicted NAD/FAD-binding protein